MSDRLFNKFKPVDPRGKQFITAEGKIDVELLHRVFMGILADAEKCNRDVDLAGRRFRTFTTELGKTTFLNLRKITPIK